MTSPRVQLAPLRKEVRVPQGIHEAFRLFTEEIGSWWPLASHSVGGERSRSVEVETRVGGRIVEVFTDDDGRDATAVWGTVVAWDPPHRLRITWHPGSAEDEATEVEVRFSSTPDGALVELVHLGWEGRADGDAARRRYDQGWDLVLGRLTRRAAEVEG